MPKKEFKSLKIVQAHLSKATVDGNKIWFQSNFSNNFKKRLFADGFKWNKEEKYFEHQSDPKTFIDHHLKLIAESIHFDNYRVQPLTDLESVNQAIDLLEIVETDSVLNLFPDKTIVSELVRRFPLKVIYIDREPKKSIGNRYNLFPLNIDIFDPFSNTIQSEVVSGVSKIIVNVPVFKDMTLDEGLVHFSDIIEYNGKLAAIVPKGSYLTTDKVNHQLFTGKFNDVILITK